MFGVYLCESPPVHVCTSNEDMFPVNNPELAVEDALCQAAKVHLPHLNSFRQKETRWRKVAHIIKCKSKRHCSEYGHKGKTCKPFSSKTFKSVEFVLTLGTLVTTRTDTFLEGSSWSSLRISLPCRGGQTHGVTRPFSQTQRHASLCFSHNSQAYQRRS